MRLLDFLLYSGTFFLYPAPASQCLILGKLSDKKKINKSRSVTRGNEVGKRLLQGGQEGEPLRGRVAWVKIPQPDVCQRAKKACVRVLACVRVGACSSVNRREGANSSVGKEKEGTTSLSAFDFSFYKDCLVQHILQMRKQVQKR